MRSAAPPGYPASAAAPTRAGGCRCRQPTLLPDGKTLRIQGAKRWAAPTPTRRPSRLDDRDDRRPRHPRAAGGVPADGRRRRSSAAAAAPSPAASTASTAARQDRPVSQVFAKEARSPGCRTSSTASKFCAGRAATPPRARSPQGRDDPGPQRAGMVRLRLQSARHRSRRTTCSTRGARRDRAATAPTTRRTARWVWLSAVALHGVGLGSTRWWRRVRAVAQARRQLGSRWSRRPSATA